MPGSRPMLRNASACVPSSLQSTPISWPRRTSSPRRARNLPGFLETPAFALPAPDLAKDEPLLAAETMVGPYRIVDLLARGGMGDVYRATDVRLRRDVALKVLAPDRTGDTQRVERFVQEARVTASLDHPNIVRLYDIGVVDGRPYFVAELLDGETLRARIERGPLAMDEVLRIGADVARGLVRGARGRIGAPRSEAGEHLPDACGRDEDPRFRDRQARAPGAPRAKGFRR